MKKLLCIATTVVLCLSLAGIASAATLEALLPPAPPSGSDPVTNVPFPSAGDAYCSATNGCGTIPAGGQTAYMWTAGDYVMSSVFTLPTTSVTDLTANWIFQDDLNGSDELWYVYVNGVAVASADLPDCGDCGSYGTVSGTVTFSGIAPVAGGYQIELVLQNTVPDGEGSVAWADGGITGLSYASAPEPGSMVLLGSGILGLAGMLRRKRL